MKEKISDLILKMIPATFVVVCLITYFEESKNVPSSTMPIQLVVILLLVIELVAYFLIKKDNK